MTSFRQVSWLAGRHPSPPSQALHGKAQWHVNRRRQLRAQLRTCLAVETAQRTRIPYWPINVISTPELGE